MPTWQEDWAMVVDTGVTEDGTVNDILGVSLRFCRRTGYSLGYHERVSVPVVPAGARVRRLGAMLAHEPILISIFRAESDLRFCPEYIDIMPFVSDHPLFFRASFTPLAFGGPELQYIWDKPCLLCIGHDAAIRIRNEHSNLWRNAE